MLLSPNGLTHAASGLMWTAILLLFVGFASSIGLALAMRRKRLQNAICDIAQGGKPGPLRIVIMVAGTRGDVQPAVALALRLQQDGHYVRLATHEPYRDFAVQAGVKDFFPLGGDPVTLTKVAVESRGILPCSFQAMLDIREQYKQIIYSTLPAATQPITGDWPADNPCKPSLIITTPITFGAAHVAEALRIPVHIISAVPWAPSKDLAHPWARAWDMSWPEMVTEVLQRVFPPVKHDITTDATQKLEKPLTIPGTADTLASTTTNSGTGGIENIDNMNSSNVQNPRQMTSGTKAGFKSKFADWYTRNREKVVSSSSRWAAWASTGLLDHIVWLGILDQLAVFRVQKLGLWPFGPANHGWHLYKWPTLFSFSPALVPQPSDWPDRYTVTGQLLLAHVEEPVGLAGRLRSKAASLAMHRSISVTHDIIPDFSPLWAYSRGLYSRTHGERVESQVAGQKRQEASKSRFSQDQSSARVPTQQLDAFAEGAANTSDVSARSLATISPFKAVAAEPASPEDHEHAPPQRMSSSNLTAANSAPPLPATSSIESDGSFDMPLALERFLDQGEPPIYIGFGSAAVHDSSHLALSILQAAVASNTRVLINRAMWVGMSSDHAGMSRELQEAAEQGEGDISLDTLGDVSAEKLAKLVHLVEDMPHDILLPRCNAVVHHGGAGTLHAGLMAGCPTLICPCYGDNYFWGEVVARLGAGPKPLPAHLLTATNLQQAFEELKQAHFKEAVEQLQSEMVAERGLDKAVAHIYRWSIAPIQSEAKKMSRKSENGMTVGQDKLNALAALKQRVRSRTGREEQTGNGSCQKTASPTAASPDGNKLQTVIRQAKQKLCRFWY